MNANTNSVLSRLVDRVFPRTPDFYSLLNEQCDLAVEAMESFVQFMESGDEGLAREVRALEKRGDELKARNNDILNKAFSTPMDREDIYRAITSIDHIVNYAKTTTREIEVLKVEPDKYMLELSVLLKEGAYALQRGYRSLSEHPHLAEADAQAARKAERSSEKVYRRALGELFRTEGYLAELENQQTDTKATAVSMVIDIFKRREVYRHLSNAADRLARAGEVLHDIVVKIS
jgi:predicted phosphate transport protein (TIGR00153 family)